MRRVKDQPDIARALFRELDVLGFHQLKRGPGAIAIVAFDVAERHTPTPRVKRTLIGLHSPTLSNASHFRDHVYPWVLRLPHPGQQRRAHTCLVPENVRAGAIQILLDLFGVTRVAIHIKPDIVTLGQHGVGPLKCTPLLLDGMIQCRIHILVVRVISGVKPGIQLLDGEQHRFG